MTEIAPEPGSAKPTMAGFAWTDRVLLPSPMPAENQFCLRDAICQLLGWPPGSPDCQAFIEAPDPADMAPLFDHLGLRVYDVGIDQHRVELEAHLDHPGIAAFRFTRAPMSHAVYVGHLCSLLRQWPLPIEYAPYGPELFWVIADLRQSPQT